jgi:two-component system response regulator ResD
LVSGTILVVDDEARMRELVRVYLQREGFRVVEASDGHEALDKLSQENVVLVILDLMMPEMDGWEFCRRVRQTSDVPILMLTARGDVSERVLGLNLGADDYLTKPFEPMELVARVQARLRRRTPPEGAGEGSILRGDLVIEPPTRRVIYQGEEITLTPKEFDLLALLARHPGRVFTREQLLEQVWGMDFYGETRTVDTHVKNLREKLGRSQEGKRLIATVWGVGYKFEGSPA